MKIFTSTETGGLGGIKFSSNLDCLRQNDIPLEKSILYSKRNKAGTN